MITKVITGITMTLIFAAAAGAGEAPHTLGGFTLGESIDGYADRTEQNTTVKVLHTGCLMEVDVVPPDGFESGSINYGTCAARNIIVRVKLKYVDGSPRFYEALLARYKERFGPPDEWKGDPFHVVVAWKWYFKDRNGNKISLILQHNRQDEDEKIGNSVKLTFSNQMTAEIRHHRNRLSKDKSREDRDRSAPEWEKLLPR
jgi:hypothetical protein